VPLRALRRPPRPRLRRRAAADRQAPLHERHRHGLPPGPRGPQVVNRRALLAALGFRGAAAAAAAARRSRPGAAPARAGAGPPRCSPRLLLVHGAALRRARRRPRHHLGLRRRPPSRGRATRR
jgi:hypothetical protein